MMPLSSVQTSSIHQRRRRTLALGLGLVGLGSLLGGCTVNGPAGWRVSELNLYGGTRERLVWIYGEKGGTTTPLKLEGQALTLGTQLKDPLATPGSLSVNGNAVYRAPTAPMLNPLNLSRTTSGQFNIVTVNPTALSAIYFTDGRSWQKLSALSGTVSAQPVSNLRGLGALSDDEADAITQGFKGKGSLALLVLKDIPEQPLMLDPKPKEYRRSAVFVLPNVPTVVGNATTIPPVTSPAKPPSPSGASVSFKEVRSGSNASVQEASVRVATDDRESRELFSATQNTISGTVSTEAVGTDTLVGVFMGSRPTGGYSIKVIRANAENGLLTLTVQLNSPKPGSITTQALTSPWTVVRVPGRYQSVKVLDSDGRAWP